VGKAVSGSCRGCFANVVGDSLLGVGLDVMLSPTPLLKVSFPYCMSPTGPSATIRNSAISSVKD